MDLEKASKWSARLRSGQDTQGTGALNRNGTMCCLGVLSDMAADEGVCTRDGSDSQVSYDSEDVYPPNRVVDWASLSAANPRVWVPEFSATLTLAELNDDKEYTFEQIADLIDANAANL